MRVKKRVKRGVKKGIKRVKSAPPEADLAGAGAPAGSPILYSLPPRAAETYLFHRSASPPPRRGRQESQESDVPEEARTYRPRTLTSSRKRTPTVTTSLRSQT